MAVRRDDVLRQDQQFAHGADGHVDALVHRVTGELDGLLQ